MKDLIDNQRRIPKDQWRYGFRSSAATGCGWIATYNALRLMGYHPKQEALIRMYGLPTESPYPPSLLIETALRDKKRNKNTVDIVIPREIGRCEILRIGVEEMMHFLEVGCTL